MLKKKGLVNPLEDEDQHGDWEEQKDGRREQEDHTATVKVAHRNWGAESGAPSRISGDSLRLKYAPKPRASVTWWQELAALEEDYEVAG